MKGRGRFALSFIASSMAGIYVHELGHAVVAWGMGIGAVPTPLKEYLLLDQVEWGQRIWISLGGVVGSIVVAMGVVIWYSRKDRPWGDAILAGILLTPWAYTIRFLLVGRGHDGLEWQEVQSALGASPSGHIVDYVFLFLALTGSVAWILRRRSTLHVFSFVKAFGLMVSGFVLLVALQVTNNLLFDPFFPTTRTVSIPPTVQPNE
jgi:hypothetical protein